MSWSTAPTNAARRSWCAARRASASPPCWRRRVRARAHGMLILTATGVQSEAHLSFAGLHQLLRPLLAEVGDLPDPQRDVLLTAFGMTSAAAPDLFLIALAALDLLAAAAARVPLLL